MTAGQRARVLARDAIAVALRTGGAEMLGRHPGDTVYLAGHFWHLTQQSGAYERVEDPIQIAACATALRRLRTARRGIGAHRW
jgi:hypothetical protein